VTILYKVNHGHGKKRLEKLRKISFRETFTGGKSEVEKWYASFEADAGFTDRLTDSEKEALENKLLRRIDQKIGSLELKKTGSIRPFKIFGSERKIRPLCSYSYKIAAVVIGLLIVAAIGYEALVNNTVVYSTGYGETHKILLSDGSTVVLNGNSTISYGKELSTDATKGSLFKW
jgi:ferric-dicitrate binding protein FerR (iron transport regulator)